MKNGFLKIYDMAVIASLAALNYLLFFTGFIRITKSGLLIDTEVYNITLPKFAKALGTSATMLTVVIYAFLIISIAIIIGLVFLLHYDCARIITSLFTFFVSAVGVWLSLISIGMVDALNGKSSTFSALLGSGTALGVTALVNPLVGLAAGVIAYFSGSTSFSLLTGATVFMIITLVLALLSFSASVIIVIMKLAGKKNEPQVTAATTGYIKG